MGAHASLRALDRYSKASEDSSNAYRGKRWSYPSWAGTASFTEDQKAEKAGRQKDLGGTTGEQESPE